MATKPPLPDPLNICLITQKFSLEGGALEGGYLPPIIRNMATKGHSITVLSQGEGDTQVSDIGASHGKITTYYMGTYDRPFRGRRYDKHIQKKFLELHKAIPFHIIHIVDPAGRSVAQLKKYLPLAVAVDARATQMSQLFSILGMAKETVKSRLMTGLAVAYKFLRTYYEQDRALMRLANGIFVTSPRQRLTLERYYMYPDAKIHTVPYGMEIGDLSPREPNESLREKLEVPKDGHVAVTCTDMIEINEIFNILSAFETVATKKPKSRLFVLGHGPKFKLIEKHMLDLALGSKVKLLGNVPHTEILDYLALADVFIDISVKSTGFDPIMLEAMAQKKVIIGSELGALITLVEDGVNGFLIRPADVSSLSRLLLDIFTGRLQTHRIGEQARRKILRMFDVNRMTHRTLASYYVILEQTRRYFATHKPV